jgi:DNA-binding beta-propeller fold protein YncE
LGVGLVAVFCVLAGVLVLGAGPALAARSHVFEKAFGEPCTTTPCGNGQFEGPSGVAVNEATGEVYVVDKGDNRVEWFNSTATFEGQFNGSGLLPNEGLNKPRAPLERPEGVAIDNTCHLHEQKTGKPLTGKECESLDPSSGDVYVVDMGHDVIDKFSSTGGYIGQLAESESGSLFGALEGVAVDPEGKVWVYQESGQIDSFSDALANEFQASRSSPFGTGPGFAVDSKGSLYVRRGEPYFAKLNSSGQELIESIDEEESTAAAVDLSNNDGSSDDVYIDNVTTVGKFSTTGSKSTLIERFGSGHLTSGSGIAVSSSSGDVYVADAATDAVDIFNLPPTPPTIDNTSTGTITSESADLRASINPNGEDTTYHFEYGTSTSTSYGASTPQVDIGSGQIDQAVTQHVTGLRPNTTYHFRVVAHNITGTETGHDDTFVYDTAGEGLPDGRAYEMVTPAQKAGSSVEALPATVAADGSSLAGASKGAFAGVSNAEIPPLGSVFYRFTRTASGWTTAPLQIPRGDGKSIGVEDSLWSPANLGSEVDHLSLREADGSVSDIGPVWLPALGPDPTESGVSYIIQGAAGEASHGVVFSIGQAALLWPFDTDVVGGNVVGGSLYEYVGVNNSEPTLVGVSGAAGSATLIGQCGTELGAANHVFKGSKYNAISESGQRVFFTAEADSTSLSPTSTSTWASTSTCASGGKTGTAPPADELYARMGGSQTVWVSEPQCTPASTCHNVTTEPYTTQAASQAAGVLFEGASADGSKVFFTTTQQLTNGDTDTTRDLYEYDFDAPAGQRLTQLSAGGFGDATPGAGAEVEGVSRISEDGSHLYFVANGVLTTNPSPGAQGYGAHGEQVSSGAVAQAGAENLYVYDTETKQTAFIAELCSGPEASGGVADSQCPSSLNSNPWNYGANQNDQALWSHGSKGGDERPPQSTPDGRFLVFTSYGDLTGDDTSTARQVFEYDAQEERLVRVSVGQDGFDNNGNTDADNASPSTSDTANASIVTQPYDETGVASGSTRGGAIARTMSEDGSYVFFQSPVGLTSQALNEVPIDSEGNLAQNVYEYHDGRVSLISDGRDTSEASGSSSVHLIGTDASGADVFFTTVDSLVAQDTDTQIDIYDARIGGGFPAQIAPSECQGETCQGLQGAPPLFGAPSSATFSGPGNLPPLPASLVTKPKPKPLTRAQKLAKALQACAKKPKKKRRDCKSRARNRYGHTARAKKSDRSGK